MSIQIISHTQHSRFIEKQGMGEIANAQKLKTLLAQSGYSINEIWDVYELFGGGFAGYCNIAQLTVVNGSLAKEGQELIEDFQFDFIQNIETQVEEIYKTTQTLFILTWDFNLAALLGTGIHKSFATIAKCYAFQPEEKIPKTLFNSCQLVITESLLGNHRAISSGIPEWKMIYLPHHYPIDIERYFPENNPDFKHNYLCQIAQECNKKIFLNDKSIVIGLFGRFQFRKNIEAALFACQRLVKEFPHLILLVKGDFDSSADANEGKGYTSWLQKLFEEFSQYPWFLWDRNYTSFPEVLNEYASSDIVLNLSGAESASNSVVEFLALKRACLVLNASSNPFLFNGGVQFVKVTEKFKQGKLFFRQPDLEDLTYKLRELILNESQRVALGKKAHTIAQKRFSPSLTLDRMPLIMDSARAYKEGRDLEKYQAIISQLYKDDQIRYEIPSPF